MVDNCFGGNEESFFRHIGNLILIVEGKIKFVFFFFIVIPIVDGVIDVIILIVDPIALIPLIPILFFFPFSLVDVICVIVTFFFLMIRFGVDKVNLFGFTRLITVDLLRRDSGYASTRQDCRRVIFVVLI